MNDVYVVEDPDPNNFIVKHVGGDGSYVFHVVPVEKGRALSPASWNRHRREANVSVRVPDAARTFAESQARRLGLID